MSEILYLCTRGSKCGWTKSGGLGGPSPEDWASHISKAQYKAQGTLSVMSLGYDRSTILGFFTLGPTISRARGVLPHPSQGESGIIIKNLYLV